MDPFPMSSRLTAPCGYLIQTRQLRGCLMGILGRPLKRGGRGLRQVYKGLRRGVHEVAIKQLGNLSDPQLIRQFRKEIAILGRVSFQPNIVNFYGACLRDPANIMLIMELMAGALPPPPCNRVRV